MHVREKSSYKQERKRDSDREKKIKTKAYKPEKTSM